MLNGSPRDGRGEPSCQIPATCAVGSSTPTSCEGPRPLPVETLLDDVLVAATERLRVRIGSRIDYRAVAGDELSRPLESPRDFDWESVQGLHLKQGVMPAPAAPCNFKYYGGPVLQNVEVVTVYWTGNIDSTITGNGGDLSQCGAPQLCVDVFSYFPPRLVNTVCGTSVGPPPAFLTWGVWQDD